MSKANNEALGWYGHMVKVWPTKHVGAVPAAETLANVHALGCRPGKQAMAIAMALRPVGVTGPQIVMVCGAPQLNKMRGLITDGVVKREAVPPQGDTGHTVYKLTLTAKGAAKVKAAGKAAAEAKPTTAAKPGKAAKAAKPRKAKAVAKPDTALAADAAAVTAAAAAEIKAAADKAAGE
jgi:hypothetical protein